MINKKFSAFKRSKWILSNIKYVLVSCSIISFCDPVSTREMFLQIRVTQHDSMYPFKVIWRDVTDATEHKAVVVV